MSARVTERNSGAAVATRSPAPLASELKTKLPPILGVALGVLLCAVVSGSVVAQPRDSPPIAEAHRVPAPPPLSVDGRYALQVLVATLEVYEEPNRTAPIIAQLQEGAKIDALERRDAWYRIALADGRPGWIDYVVAVTGPNFSVADADARADANAIAAPPDALSDDRVVVRQPMGAPLEAVIPTIDPRQVPPPQALLPRESIPVPDRWRLMDQLGLIHPRWYDPYNPNPIKGDRPMFGEDWFVNAGAVSDTLFEWRQVPTPIGAQSTQEPGSNNQFGGSRQSLFNQNFILSLSLIKGDTTFRPPDYEFRFVPVINFNRTQVDEVRVLNIDPREGTTRNDSFVAVQELFVDKHLRNVSDQYDFDAIRVGIQPFTADFRGLLFIDQPLGVRLFGTRDNNQWQYNLGWFRRLEKDTNSGLNDIGKPLRDENILVANLYRQDFMVPGFTLQGTVIYDDDRENHNVYYDNNGFLTRPAALGDESLHTYQVTYLGLNGDGHFGRWNLSASLYYALGTVNHDPIAQQKVDVNALYAVAEVSRDFDWIRVRGTGIFQSGDRNPFDGKANGFDAIQENPQIAGADTSYWIRQAVPLIGGGGVALSGRNGVLAALRSSKDEGQANFINPGLGLVGIGADIDVSPEVRVIGNLNQLWFENTSSLGVLRQQGTISTSLGTDVSVAVQYRPWFSQNIVLNGSAAFLFPGAGLKQLYAFDSGKTQYSILANVVLTF
jgi:Bacterial SH3 domain